MCVIDKTYIRMDDIQVFPWIIFVRLWSGCHFLWTMGCEKRLEFKQNRRSPCHYHTVGKINSCQWDISRWRCKSGRCRLPNKDQQRVPNMKLKSSKISSDRFLFKADFYLKLHNSKIVTSPNTSPDLKGAVKTSIGNDFCKIQKNEL